MQTTYLVQLWPDGKLKVNPYQKVRAGSPKQAAETLYGAPLQEEGSHHQIRAQVRVTRAGIGIAFYDRS
jgi:hypothetical protein